MGYSSQDILRFTPAWCVPGNVDYGHLTIHKDVSFLHCVMVFCWWCNKFHKLGGLDNMKLSSYDSVGQKSNISFSLGQNQGVSRAVFPEAFGENLFLCFFQLPEAAHFLAHEHLSPPSRPVMASLVLLTLCVFLRPLFHYYTSSSSHCWESFSTSKYELTSSIRLGPQDNFPPKAPQC